MTIKFKSLMARIQNGEKVDNVELIRALGDADQLFEFADEVKEAWENGMGGDRSLYNSAKGLLEKVQRAA